MKRMTKVALVALVAFAMVSAVAHAATVATAERIADKRAAMKPVTDFEKWLADRWVDAAKACYKNAGAQVGGAIKEMVYFGTKPEIQALSDADCGELAGNPRLYCHSFEFKTPALKSVTAGLPNTYKAIEAASFKDGLALDVKMRCQLDEFNKRTEAMYEGKGVLKVIASPMKMTLRTKAGELVDKNIGTALVTVPGTDEKAVFSFIVE
jgi:hypothetical protein